MGEGARTPAGVRAAEQCAVNSALDGIHQTPAAPVLSRQQAVSSITAPQFSGFSLDFVYSVHSSNERGGAIRRRRRRRFKTSDRRRRFPLHSSIYIIPVRKDEPALLHPES